MKNSSEITKYRHRIHELFSEERLDGIEAVIHNPALKSNNDRVDAILDLLKDMEISMIGAGTNRMSILKDEYIYKIALDALGKQDNWTEFNMSVELQPYVTKTYECNGIIAVAEYVNLFSKEEFELSKDNISAILEILAEDYLFCDLSTTSKNFVNFGYRDTGEIVILDFGYIYPIDRKIMRCRRCGGELIWNNNYTLLFCRKCRKDHDPIEIRDRMRKKETDFHQLEHLGEGPLVLKLGT